MLIATKLLFFVNKILDHHEWINEYLIDFKIDVIGNRKELCLVYKPVDLKMFESLVYYSRYEHAFIRAEYVEDKIRLYFAIPNHLFYTVDYYLNVLNNIQTDEEIKSLEDFYTKKPELSF